MDKKVEEEKYICPNCGRDNVQRVQQNYPFPYGIGENSIVLTALILVTKCRSCGEMFLDSIAQDLCHEAVCKHLGVMTPMQIQNLREKYSHTPEVFAELIGVTKDKLLLWERGIQIQNKAYDNLLHLLEFEDNFKRLINRRKK